MQHRLTLTFDLSKIMKNIIWHTCRMYISKCQTTISDSVEGTNLQ